MNINQANISTYVGLILMPILGYFAVSESTSNAIIGVISAIIFLMIQVWNEKNNSNILSNNNTEDPNDNNIEE